jgi:hypothetical protein
MSEEGKNAPVVKKEYEPPKVLRVSLRPEEAVLGHCKIPGVAGVASPGCGAVIHCRTWGS